MCRIVLLTCLFLAVSACTTRADVLYTLALTGTDGSGINGTGSFTLSQLPQPPTAESTSVIRTYRPPYDQNPPDPYGDFLENMDFNIDGLHFFWTLPIHPSPL